MTDEELEAMYGKSIVDGWRVRASHAFYVYGPLAVRRRREWNEDGEPPCSDVR